MTFKGRFPSFLKRPYFSKSMEVVTTFVASEYSGDGHHLGIPGGGSMGWRIDRYPGVVSTAAENGGV